MILAVSAIALSGASLGQANAGASAGAAGLRGASEEFRLAEPVARVCREVCRENVCRTRCFDERARDEVIHERVYRDEDRRDYRDERRYRRPGVEFNAPGLSIETR